MRAHTLPILLTAAFNSVNAFSSYADAFVDPAYALSKTWPESTKAAQAQVLEYADWLAAQGPWTVTSKTVLPPTNNTHDYLSWLPYWWPDCSNVGNTTELTDQQIYTECTYVVRDGQFNPDQRLVNDTGAFQAMSDAVFANGLAWAINGSSVYSGNVANFIKTWFIAPETMMNPNLDYAQLKRGPGEQKGSHTGVLDLKSMSKVASAVLIMRQGKPAEWTSDIDSGLVSWTTQYIKWMESSPIALEEKAATNNHGSFYYTQLAALKLIVNDKPAAVSVVQAYLSSIYQNQITANGSQPFELVRTRPFHYLTYNLAAMITSAKIAQFAGFNMWNTTTKSGAGIPAAADFTMAFPSTDEVPDELWPQIASVAAVYGDPSGKYAAFLKSQEPDYPLEPFFFYEQPLSDSGFVPNSTTDGTSAPGKTSNVKGSDASGASALGVSAVLAVGASILASLI